MPPAQPHRNDQPHVPRSAVAPAEPATFMFVDDGLIPNNPALPLILYRSAVAVAGAHDPAALLEQVFAVHGWGDMWRNGIYGFAHYHAMIHEVCGIAHGRARVRFGGTRGEEIDLAAGDVVILPAGTGHQRLTATRNLLVVGAYPPEGTYDLCRPTPTHHARALETIPRVPLPHTDPVHGHDGPLMRLWSRK